MTKKDLNNWIMYHEIHRLSRLGFSISKISRYLVLNRRTVKKYLQMAEEDYEQNLLRLQYRNKILTPYELFVVEKLTSFPDTSSAQIHDWIKEHYTDLPQVSSKTVYNFVMFIRQKYNIPLVPIFREYFPIEELNSLRKLGSRLQGHPATDHKLPGVETSAGSLGQGLGVAIGSALNAKLENKKYKV